MEVFTKSASAGKEANSAPNEKYASVVEIQKLKDLDDDFSKNDDSSESVVSCSEDQQVINP
jgi:hypothetical protein